MKGTGQEDTLKWWGEKDEQKIALQPLLPFALL